MKLQQKLFIPLIFIVTLPVLAIGVVAYDYILQNSKNVLSSEVSSLANSLAPSLNQTLETTESNLRLITNSRLLQDYITRDEQRYSVFQPTLIRQLSDYQLIYPEYFQMNLLLENGEVDTSLDNRENPDFAFDKSDWAFYRLLQEQSTQDVASYIEQETGTNKYTISLGLPLAFTPLNNANNTDEAVFQWNYFTVTMYLDYIDELMSSLNRGTNNLLLVTDYRGNVIYNNALYGVSEELTVLETQHNVENVLIKDVVTPFYIHTKNLQHGLMLHVGIPTYKFKEAANELAQTTIMWLGFITVMILVLSLAYVRQLLLAPIYKIRHLVTDIAQGKMESGIDLKCYNDELGQLSHSILDMRSEIIENNERIETLAYIDELTGLPNRLSFQSNLDTLIAYAKRHDSAFSVVFLDLDNFKIVNDTLGHDVGDILLQRAAQRVKALFNINDVKGRGLVTQDRPFFARLGGDEFTLLLPGQVDKEKLSVTFKQLVHDLSQAFHIEHNEVFIGASIGISMFPFDGTERKELLKNADIAMYESKSLGKNKHTFFTESIKDKVNEQQFIETSMLKALTNNEFSLVYQPRITVDDYGLDGFEALIRWQHPEKGNVPPNLFIPVAEKNLQILDIGRWVLDAACQKIQSWVNDGLQNFRVSINVSTVQLHRADLYTEIAEALSKYKISGQYLEIEITETAILKDEMSAIKKLEHIKTLGVRISVDDFGTGYSSLSKLRTLPVDVLKIDQSFMADISDDLQAADVLGGIIELAKRLGLTTVAEGVELSTQHDVLISQHCDQAQGYFYAKPLLENVADGYVQECIGKVSQKESQQTAPTEGAREQNTTELAE